jgi:signal peptidase I
MPMKMKSRRLDMKKVFSYAKFGIGLVLILVFYKNIILIHGTEVIDANDPSMEPTLRPRGRFYYHKTVRTVDQLKKQDLIIFRPPDKPQDWRVARIKGVPGETVKGKEIPRDHLYLESDSAQNRKTYTIHEHFVIGRLHHVKFLPRDEGR